MESPMVKGTTYGLLENSMREIGGMEILMAKELGKLAKDRLIKANGGLENLKDSESILNQKEILTKVNSKME